jgi:hypothetical protein
VRSARTPRWKTALSTASTRPLDNDSVDKASVMHTQIDSYADEDDVEDDDVEEEEEEEEEEEDENTAVSGAVCIGALAEGEKESSDVFEDDAQRVRCLVSNLVCVRACVCVCVCVALAPTVHFISNAPDAAISLARGLPCVHQFTHTPENACVRVSRTRARVHVKTACTRPPNSPNCRLCLFLLY